MRRILIAAVMAFVPPAAHAAPLSPQQQRQIDESVTEWLARTGAPSVSIAVASGNGIAYAKAYGFAHLHPDLRATVDTRYDIDSISKQFTAAAILILQEEGKLSLDDKIAKYFPGLAGADKVTIREILSHTAGYQDSGAGYLITPERAKPITVAAFLNEWATKPLQFEPGTQWRYSNTGFKIAGAIVEKVTGEPLISFLRSHIFGPLNMTGATEDDSAPLRTDGVDFYARFANGPIRSAAREGAGWRFAGGELAMSAGDLARWDISLINRSLLKPQSYDALYTSTKLKNGSDTGYSLGLSVWRFNGRLGMGHDGGGFGALAETREWPVEKIAIVALTNNDWADPADVISRIAYIVLPPTPPEARARAVFDGFREGKINRTLFTDNANAFLTPLVVADQKAGLAPLGQVRTFSLLEEFERGSFKGRTWKIVTANANLNAIELVRPDGKLEQFRVLKTE